MQLDGATFVYCYLSVDHGRIPLGGGGGGEQRKKGKGRVTCGSKQLNRPGRLVVDL